MRRSQKGKNAVYLEIGFWLDEQDQAIRLASNDPDVKTLHVAVRSDQSKPSGHPYLFRELAKCLRQMGAPAPDDQPSN